MKKGTIELDGISFHKRYDGYYSNRKHGRMHRYIYEKANGKIPEGYVIHHKDYKINGCSNNNIENLECLSESEHKKLHARELSDETRKKMSETSKRENLSLTTLKKMSESHRGLRPTEETRKKLSNSKRKESLSDETLRKRSESLKGHLVSETTRNKISNSLTGVKLSKERATNIGIGHHKAVICVETGEIFESVKLANIFAGTLHVSACCKGKRKTTGGYHWEYV